MWRRTDSPIPVRIQAVSQVMEAGVIIGYLGCRRVSPTVRIHPSGG